MSEFSLQLNEDQLQIQKWVHDFAEDVVRPAAEEWDEREEFPWPIVEEAAKIGLYGFDFIAQAMLGDPTGLTLPVALEELFWGDAGIGLSIFGSGLAAAGIAGNGTPEQVHRVGAAVLRHPRQGPARRVLRVRARRRLRRQLAAHPGRLRRGQGRVGAQRHQGVDHQRRHRRRPRRRGHRRSRAQGPGPGQLRRPAGHHGPVAGPEVQEARHPGVAHRPRSCSTTSASPAACLLGGKEKLDEKLARAREASRGPAAKQPAMATFEATRPAVGARPSASPGPPTSTRSSTPRSARRSASRSSRTRRSRSCWPTWPPRSTPPACSSTGPPGWHATAATRTPRARCPSSRPAAPPCGSPSGPSRSWAATATPASTRSSGWHRDAKIYDIFEGTEQIQQLVIARAICGLRIE